MIETLWRGKGLVEVEVHERPDLRSDSQVQLRKTLVGADGIFKP